MVCHLGPGSSPGQGSRYWITLHTLGFRGKPGMTEIENHTQLHNQLIDTSPISGGVKKFPL